MQNEDTIQWIEDTSKEDYIDKLKQALKDKKMTQTEFARICGCSPSRISTLINKRYWGQVPKYIWKQAKVYLGV